MNELTRARLLHLVFWATFGVIAGLGWMAASRSDQPGPWVVVFGVAAMLDFMGLYETWDGMTGFEG